MNRFDRILSEHQLEIRRAALTTLQINVGRKCNQACRHCHVDAAPWRTEMMSEATALRVGEWITDHRPRIVDITGGAPELSAHFRYFVKTAKAAGADVIDRNNLTILTEPGFEDLPEFLAENDVEVIASLPCYSAENVNRQRGNGVFDKSILGLRKLNGLGYGTIHPLHLVYNPLGANLPGPQAELEADYKEALERDFGIVFNKLLTITNQPIARFAEDLRKQGLWDDYLELLANSFNPETLSGLMCRNTISIGYEGEVFDCDFNQMLEMPPPDERFTFLWNITPDQLPGARVSTGVHCLACTAGAGSSCTGALS
ncbi:MAG: arsenosugar biosynthesis radical SAM protein ArsS [Verrucomicrobiae bacterium]|jgi:radical SAM/Cys-rich protein|nr:arsenosugar biosynthesis radical SAM protein ArsS [Verrucomicrobiae bacterium]